MATLTNSVHTMFEWGQGIDPKGKVAHTIKMLAETNDMDMEMLVKEGNLPTGEQTTIQTGLPTAYYVGINQGVPSSTQTKVQVTEHAAILSTRSTVDKNEATLNGNINAYRMDSAAAHVASMGNQSADTMINGSAANPKEFVGFLARYNDLSAANAVNILDAGGTGSDNMSILFVGWGAQSVHAVFPKGSPAGLDHEDLGLIDADDDNGDPYRAYADVWTLKRGLVVKDWRYVARIANIDKSDLAGQVNTQAPTASTAVIKMMARAIDRFPSLTAVKTVFYVNRTIASLLRVAAMDKSASAVTIEDGLNQFGDTIKTMKFLGHPVRIVDALGEAEAQVT